MPRCTLGAGLVGRADAPFGVKHAALFGAERRDLAPRSTQLAARVASCVVARAVVRDVQARSG